MGLGTAEGREEKSREEPGSPIKWGCIDGSYREQKILRSRVTELLEVCERGDGWMDQSRVYTEGIRAYVSKSLRTLGSVGVRAVLGWKEEHI